MSTKMVCQHWRFIEEYPCVKLDEMDIPIPGDDGQPQLQRYPIVLEVGDKIGSMFGGVELIASPYDKLSNKKVITSLMHHAERIAPFAEFIVAPAFKVFWLDGQGSVKHEDTADIYDMWSTGVFHRSPAALFSAGRDQQATREIFWKALIATIASEKRYLDEVFQHRILRGWSDVDLAIQGCYTFAARVLGKIDEPEGEQPPIETALGRGGIKAEHLTRLDAEFGKGSWAVFTYLWTVYADLACELLDCGQDFKAPHDEAEDHLWFFYRVFRGVEGDKIEKLHIGSWYDVDLMYLLRANYLAPASKPKAEITPMVVPPIRKAG
ncbi:hypothetical protein HFN60_30195 [Rhizobium leguminosarum]|uniref:hypothetical protein n=1 Tax=Rhizobium leguminosarum TaxID=384 RepID=UPI001C96F67C|nr:hypothetical protein [Rhizobium leguminosarum]MBY5819865.1 hypothetical protein [Rhizobium leguminosarum]